MFLLVRKEEREVLSEVFFGEKKDSWRKIGVVGLGSGIASALVNLKDKRLVVFPMNGKRFIEIDVKRTEIDLLNLEEMKKILITIKIPEDLSKK